MSQIEQRIPRHGLQLPAPFRFPGPNRTGCVLVGNVLLSRGATCRPGLA